MEWISVKEKRPKYGERVITVCDKKFGLLVSEDTFLGEENGENCEWFENSGYTITHWMPLPKPPEEEK